MLEPAAAVSTSTPAFQVKALYGALYWVQVISFATYTQVSSVAFAAFECEEFDTGRYLLKADYLVDCRSHAWSSIVALAVGAIVVRSARFELVGTPPSIYSMHSWCPCCFEA